MGALPSYNKARGPLARWSLARAGDDETSHDISSGGKAGLIGGWGLFYFF